MVIVKTWRKTPDIYPLQQIRVVDGDTLEAQIILPFDCTVVKRIRLKGWWADELTGPYSTQGMAAKLVLEQFVKTYVLWLHAPSCRLDKYGRVIGHLLVDNQIVNPTKVLGPYQLSERVHNAHKAQAKASGVGPSHALRGEGGRYIADDESKRVLGHPEAILDPATGDLPTGWDCWCGPAGTHQGLEICPLPSPKASNPGHEVDVQRPPSCI